MGHQAAPPPRDLLRQSGVEGPLRLLALRRDKYQCTMMTCTTPGRGTGGRPIVDHIIERTKGGADDLPNLVHVEISTKPSRDVRNGSIRVVSTVRRSLPVCPGTPMNGHPQCRWACLKRANRRHRMLSLE